MANLARSVTFSHKNRCRDLFTIRYRTREGGYLEPRMSHDNQASPEERGRYDDYGNEVVFRFVPRNAGEEYSLNVDIYKGFSLGNREVHFHLCKQSRYKRLRYALDLSAYLKAGYRLTQAPRLYFHDTDPEDHDVCRVRGLGSSIEPRSTEGEGVWRWEIENVRQGVVDFAWDVAKVPEPIFDGTAQWASLSSI